MSNATSVNDQITDSVTQSILNTVGQGPAQAMSMIDVVMGETLGMTMHNAVMAQQNSQTLGNAAVSATCARLLSATPGAPAEPPIPPIPVSPLPNSPSLGERIANDFVTAKNAVDDLVKDEQEAEQDSSGAKTLLNKLADLAKSTPASHQ